jgi:large subunit ribosomal protein L19
MKAQGFTRETVLNIEVKDRGFPQFRVGDTVEVAQIVKEGEKERIQLFAGDVIAFHRNGIGTTFTVRRLGANNIWVEKIFPYYSPIINAIRVVKRGRVRRAKLFYLRKRIGKAARIKEKVMTKEEKLKKESLKRSVEPQASSEVQESTEQSTST